MKARKRTLTDVSLAKSLAVDALATDRDYRDTLKTPLADATDPLYHDVITLYNSLTPRHRGPRRGHVLSCGPSLSPQTTP
jgi:hypothetical protein